MLGNDLMNFKYLEKNYSFYIYYGRNKMYDIINIVNEK